MKATSFYSWIFDRLTYVQTFLIICVIFFISLLPIVFFWIQIHLKQIDQIDSEIEEINHELLLKDLFTELEEHRYLAQRFLSGDATYENRLDASKTKIRATIHQLLKFNSENLTPSSNATNTLWRRIDPQKILGAWQKLTEQQNLPLTADKSEVLHTNLLQNLQVELTYLISRIHLQDESQKQNYLLSTTFAVRLPFLQENLSLLALLKGEQILSQTLDYQAERINLLIDRVKLDLSYLDQTLTSITLLTGSASHPTVFLDWTNYSDSVKDILNFVEKYDDPKKYTPELFTEIHKMNAMSLQLGSQIWVQSLEELKAIFMTERQHVRYQLWIVLLITLFLGIFAFCLGVIVTRLANKRLIELTQATENFTNGDLSIRVPDMYEDEIGMQAKAFNRMAQKLEEMIKFLYELLNATTKLSHGDLKARLSDHFTDSEFLQVAHSFNHMAEKFEDMIEKLQQMATVLTSAATDLSHSSLHQETLLNEQEKATDNIAAGASQISTTSEEFAKKMNEMSSSAVTTSQTVKSGKESLDHMQLIMHQMVKSSELITSRLSHLNDKAQNITSIVTTIVKVADQTNLLSLNASIEAEKAGEYGRGFAVIAREIRRLADQTAASTVDIEAIVEEIMHAISSTVNGVDEFTQDIRKGVHEITSISVQQTQIIDRVQTFILGFEKINQGMQLQYGDAEKIRYAITDLSQKAQIVTTSIHQLHQTINELNEASNALHKLTHSLVDDNAHISKQALTFKLK